jgi:hypothetical protein
MGYAPPGNGTFEVESAVLAFFAARGLPAFAELTGPPPEEFLSGSNRLAFMGMRALAIKGAILSPAAVEQELLRSGANGAAVEARTAMEHALRVHGGGAVPGGAGRLVSMLADLRAVPRPKVLTAMEIFAPLPPVNWLCQALGLAPGAPGLLAGYGYSGKTVSVQDFALAVATGKLAWGSVPVRAGRVVHFDWEQGSFLTRLRYQRLARARGIDPAELQGRLTLACMPEWYLDGDVDDEVYRRGEGADLLILDSYRAACPRTDENSSDARVPLDRLTRISERTGTTTLVLHHARKPARDAAGGARMSVRGSGALYDACGSVLVFVAEKGEPVTVTHEKARISGRPHEDFQLWIEDVEIDGDPTAGLRVSCLNTTTSKAGLTPSDRFEGLKSRVLDLVREKGTITGGVNLIRVHLGARKDDITAAVAELVRSRALFKGGTYKEPTYTLPPKPIPGTDRDYK